MRIHNSEKERRLFSESKLISKESKKPEASLYTTKIRPKPLTYWCEVRIVSRIKTGLKRN